jgi:hypothetical protein
MKSIYLSVLSFFVFTYSFSQLTLHKLDSITSNGFGKQVFSYDAQNRHVLTQNFNFSGSSGAYSLLDQTTNLFDNNDRLIEVEFSTVQNNVLVPNVKTLITYNGQGQIISYTNLWYDVAAGTYWNSGKTDFTYDGGGNVVEEMFFSHQSGNWVVMGKMAYTYFNGMATEMLNMGTMDNGATFYNVAKTTYAYDANSNCNEQIFYNWMNNMWDPMNKNNYTYDAAGNPTQSIAYNLQNQNWEETFKEDMVYSGNDDLTLYESFSKQGPNWVEQYKLVNTLDGSVLLANLILNEDYEYNSKITNAEYYQPAGASGSWSLIKSEEYHYSQEQGGGGSNGIGELSRSVEIYPNPSSSVVNVVNAQDYQDIRLLDAFGRLAASLNQGSQQFDVSNVENGAYLLVATDASGIVHQARVLVVR